MLDESICHLRDVESIFSLLFFFEIETRVRNNVDLGQSDLGLHCLPTTLYRFLGKNGLA